VKRKKKKFAALGVCGLYPRYGFINQNVDQKRACRNAFNSTNPTTGAPHRSWPALPDPPQLLRSIFSEDLRVRGVQVAINGVYGGKPFPLQSLGQYRSFSGRITSDSLSSKIVRCRIRCSAKYSEASYSSRTQKRHLGKEARNSIHLAATTSNRTPRHACNKGLACSLRTSLAPRIEGHDAAWLEVAPLMC